MDAPGQIEKWGKKRQICEGEGGVEGKGKGKGFVSQIEERAPQGEREKEEIRIRIGRKMREGTRRNDRVGKSKKQKI